MFFQLVREKIQQRRSSRNKKHWGREGELQHDMNQREGGRACRVLEWPTNVFSSFYYWQFVSPFQRILVIVLTAFPLFQVFQYYLVQFCALGIHNSFLRQPEQRNQHQKHAMHRGPMVSEGERLGQHFSTLGLTTSSWKFFFISLSMQKTFLTEIRRQENASFGFFSSKAWHKRFPASHTAQVSWDLSLPACVRSLLKAVELHLGKKQGI